MTSCVCSPGWRKAGPTDTIEFLEGVCAQYECQSDAVCESTTGVSGAQCVVPGWNCLCPFRYSLQSSFLGFETFKNTDGSGYGGRCMGLLYWISGRARPSTSTAPVVTYSVPRVVPSCSSGGCPAPFAGQPRCPFYRLSSDVRDAPRRTDDAQTPLPSAKAEHRRVWPSSRLDQDDMRTAGAQERCPNSARSVPCPYPPATQRAIHTQGAAQSSGRAFRQVRTSAHLHSRPRSKMALAVGTSAPQKLLARREHGSAAPSRGERRACLGIYM